MNKDYFKDWCKHNPYIPVYNPMTNTYWLVPSEMLTIIFTRYKGACKEIKGDAKYKDGYKII